MKTRGVGSLGLHDSSWRAERLRKSYSSIGVITIDFDHLRNKRLLWCDVRVDDHAVASGIPDVGFDRAIR